jgi:hypothetical protein
MLKKKKPPEGDYSTIFLGLPPNLPFARDAVDLAADLDEPPFLPIALAD